MSLSFARMREAMRSRPPPPPPRPLSVTRMFSDHIGGGRPGPHHHWELEAYVFPRIIERVREDFMVTVRFSRTQWMRFSKWVMDKDIPNLHLISAEAHWYEYKEEVYTYYVVRLMDIHWMWAEMV